MSLIKCEVNLILTWSSTCAVTYSTGERTFEKADTKLYVLVVTLSTQDNSKLLQQLKSRFKRVISWNRYLSSFQEVSRIFVLAFENDTPKTSHSGYYLPYVEIKNYNVMINGENFFDQPVKDNKVTCENI